MNKFHIHFINFLENIIYRKIGIFAQVRLILSFIIIVLVAACIATFTYVLSLPESFPRIDISQDYLLATAIMQGSNPYEPLPVLLEQYFPHVENYFNKFPSPHSPFLAVLFIPFTLFNPGIAFSLHAIISSICAIVAIIIIVVELFPDPSLRRFFFVFGLTLAFLSLPGSLNLAYGQINSELLLLIVLGWRSFKNNKDFKAGLYLGVCFSLRYFGWPLMIYFVFKRRYQVLFGVFVAITIISLTVVSIMEFAHLQYYFQQGLPSATGSWKNCKENMSLPFAFARLISPVQFYCENSGYSAIGYIAGIGASVIYLYILIKKVMFKDSAYSAFLRLIMASIILSPIAWDHYTVILILPIIVCLSQLNLRYKQILLPMMILTVCMFINFDGLAIMLGGTEIKQTLSMPWFARVIYSTFPIVLAYASIAVNVAPAVSSSSNK